MALLVVQIVILGERLLQNDPPPHHVTQLYLRHLNVGFHDSGGNKGQDDRMLVMNVNLSFQAKRLGIQATWSPVRVLYAMTAFALKVLLCSRFLLFF